MATTVTKNGYYIQKQMDQDGCGENVVADSILTVAKLFDTAQNPLVAVKMVKGGILVVEGEVPNPVTFQVAITPAGGAPQAAGCAATPSTFTVEAGTPVIFQATAGTGYSFVGWYINSVLQSTDLIASILIPVPQISGQQIQVEARFAVVP
jgi:hypothetical protein